mmetsp:Transcript_43023/g.74639  ORF Transcript_43023/g.74639 Transcript_43023/m.74639 type:complete len:210 (+) Transcript_43023:449-1078(+)
MLHPSVRLFRFINNHNAIESCFRSTNSMCTTPWWCPMLPLVYSAALSQARCHCHGAVMTPPLDETHYVRTFSSFCSFNPLIVFTTVLIAALHLIMCSIFFSCCSNSWKRANTCWWETMTSCFIVWLCFTSLLVTSSAYNKSCEDSRNKSSDCAKLFSTSFLAMAILSKFSSSSRYNENSLSFSVFSCCMILRAQEELRPIYSYTYLQQI